MTQDPDFSNRLARIEQKKAVEPPAPPPEIRKRSTFKASNQPSGGLLLHLTPSRLISIVGFAVVAVFTLNTAGSIGSNAGAHATPVSPTAANSDVDCVEIHHPLDLMRHTQNPATADIPVCDITANSSRHN